MNFYIFINNEQIFLNSNISILQVCDLLNIYIPRFCYHERLSVAGNCRMCLVEIEKMPKLQISCALIAFPQMKIYTNTLSVKKAREGILEFLLLNHPLDCAICDQAGECDLQDQSLIFGVDFFRFYEHKRAIQDKNLSPFIKTIMSRCINCTRCVRFVNEIIGFPNFGSTKRGLFTEIGSFLNKLLKSELSGNIIDICPVGALTSKPNAFLTRPWDVFTMESIDLFDSFQSNIRIDIKGYEILRIFPKLNDSLNSNLITDKTRFAFDGLNIQRITNLFFKNKDHLFTITLWNQMIFLISILILTHLKKPYQIIFFLGNFFDLESLIMIKILVHKINGLFLNDDFTSILNLDFQNLYKFNVNAFHFMKADNCLLIGLNPKVDCILIQYYLRKIFLLNRILIGFIGSVINLNLPLINVGSNFIHFINFIEGKNLFCKYFKNCKKPVLLVGKSFLHNLEYSNFNIFLKILNLNISKLLQIDWCGVHFINLRSTNVSSYNLGLITKSFLNLQRFNILYILGDDFFNYSNKIISNFIIFQNHHSSFYVQKTDFLIPITNWLEKNATFVNLKGFYQKVHQAIYPLKNTQENLIILSLIYQKLNNQYLFKVPFYAQIFKTYSKIKLLFLEMHVTFFYHTLIFLNYFYFSSSLFDNFYKTDIISIFSNNMCKSSKLINKSPFK